MELNDVIKEKSKKVFVSCRISQSTKKFIIEKDINIARLIEKAIEELKKG